MLATAVLQRIALAGSASCGSLFVGIAASGFAASALAEEPAPLRVFAAASLTEVVEGLAGRFEGRLAPSFGGSSALARQIRDGAPADVFLSASPDWIEFLREAGALSGEPIVFARNRLVCIGARRGPPAVRSARDPRSLLEAIGGAGRIAIADEGVPAGEYARSALRQLGLLEAFEPKLVGQQDVRAVLHAVEQGELSAGFVYATDAKLAQAPVLFAFDAAAHPPIEYQAAVVRGSLGAVEARRFLDFLRSELARTLLRNAGFALP